MKTTATVPFPQDLPLNQDFIRLVAPYIHKAWGYYGPDAQEFCRTNADAMEIVLDANRLRMDGEPNGVACDEFLTRMYARHGFSKVSRYLVKNVRIH